MHLERIAIRNYKAFEELDLSLVNPDTGAPFSLVALTGDNGSGKTTVLECARRAMQDPLSIWKMQSFRKAGEATWSECDFVFSEDEVREVRERTPGGASWPTIQGPSRLRSVGSATRGAPEPATRAGQGRAGILASRAREFVDSLLGVPLCRVIYIPASRGAPNPDIVKNVGKVAEPPRVLALDAWGFADVKQHLINLDYIRLKRREASGPDPLQPFSRLTSRLFEGKRFDRVTEGFSVLFRTDDGLEIDFNELSDGERTILGLFSSFIRSELRHSVYLIDEPEQHLHPRWQRRIPEILREQAELTASQFILATHSVEIAEGVQEAGGAVYTLSPALAPQEAESG